MLQDKDRIFTNLYGFDDWGLEGARRRGEGRGRERQRGGQGDQVAAGQGHRDLEALGRGCG